MTEMARALKRKDILEVLEQSEAQNEFVCATFACDLREMTNTIALGAGEWEIYLKIYDKILKKYDKIT